MFALVVGGALLLYGWKIHDRAVLVFGLCMFLFGIGYLRFLHIYYKESELPLSGRITLTGNVVEYPDFRDTSVRIVLRPDGVDEQVLVSLPVGARVSYGDAVSVSGSISIPDAFETDSGRIFDYGLYLRKEGILRQLSFADIKTIHTVHFSLKGLLFTFRSLVESRLRSVVPEPESSLVLGMLLGGKSGLGTELTNMFTRAGVIHIVVLSGYNITIIAELVRLLLMRIPFLLRSWASGITIILFVIMAGADASAVRAGCMAVIALTARATGRPYTALRALGITALLMTLWNPLIMFYDPGFILSVCATFGIIIFTDPISKKLFFIKWNSLREIVATSISAYGAVLPYLAYKIGAVSIVALVVNPIVLPLVPLAMLLGAISGVLAFLPSPLAILGVFPLVLILRVLILIVRCFSALPLASITVPAWSGIGILFLYIVAGIIYWYKNSTIRCT